MRILLAMIFAAGCGGGAEGSNCHDPNECDDGLGCLGVDDPPVCGIGPNQGCTDDGSCFGMRCHAIADGCSTFGVGSECRPPCTGDTECGPGLRCDAGACAVILCDAGAGVTCDARAVCDPSRIPANAPVFERHSGCFSVACESDATCGERFCVNGTCQDAIGTCAEPMLVP